jgi:hypothetical protein
LFIFSPFYYNFISQTLCHVTPSPPIPEYSLHYFHARSFHLYGPFSTKVGAHLPGPRRHCRTRRHSQSKGASQAAQINNFKHFFFPSFRLQKSSRNEKNSVWIDICCLFLCLHLFKQQVVFSINKSKRNIYVLDNAFPSRFLEQGESSL